MTVKRRGVGAVLTIHQSYEGGRGKDEDSQRGDIIGPGRVSHLPVDHSCNNQGLQNVYKLITIIL